MAIIKEWKQGNVTVQIDDSAIAGKTLKQCVDEINRKQTKYTLSVTKKRKTKKGA